MTSPGKTLMEAAGLPRDNLLSQRDALPESLQMLHRQTLLALGQSGKTPTRHRLKTWARELHVHLDAYLRHLADTGLVVLDPAGRDITGGVPFAARPTAHRVRIFDGPPLSANCAGDALGIAAVLGRDVDVDVESLDPSTGERVTASSRARHWTWHPVDAVVFLGSSGQRRLTEACCPVITFFATRDTALAYQRTHALHDVVLAFSDAVEAGTPIFGEFVNPWEEVA